MSLEYSVSGKKGCSASNSASTWKRYGCIFESLLTSKDPSQEQESSASIVIDVVELKQQFFQSLEQSLETSPEYQQSELAKSIYKDFITKNTFNF